MQTNDVVECSNVITPAVRSVLDDTIHAGLVLQNDLALLSSDALTPTVEVQSIRFVLTGFQSRLVNTLHRTGEIFDVAASLIDRVDEMAPKQKYLWTVVDRYGSDAMISLLNLVHSTDVCQIGVKQRALQIDDVG